jgi:hypothetical protein
MFAHERLVVYVQVLATYPLDAAIFSLSLHVEVDLVMRYLPTI